MSLLSEEDGTKDDESLDGLVGVSRSDEASMVRAGGLVVSNYSFLYLSYLLQAWPR